MAVPNKAKLSEVQAEFGAPASAKLSAFYRDGDFVPDVSLNAGVPKSGIIKLSDLDGATAVIAMVLAITGDSSPNGSCSETGGSCTADTNEITCTVTNGIGPYTITTEKQAGQTTFLPVLESSTNNSATYAYETTNSGASTTYTSQYRFKVEDSTGTIAYTNYFTVSNVHTYVEPPVAELVIVRRSPNNIKDSIGSYYNGSLGPVANGEAVIEWEVEGGGTGPFDSITLAAAPNASPYNTASLTLQNVTDDNFELKLKCTSSAGEQAGGYSWGGSWDNIVTITRNGKTATITILASVNGRNN